MNKVSKSRVGDYIMTYTGKVVYPLDPREEEIDINDIAHALSQTCRFNGHCPSFYSVAQHSVLVSQLVKPELALQALFHDAAEAYLSDVPRPVKRSFHQFRSYEHELQKVIFTKFGCAPEEHEDVKYIDKHIVANEALSLWYPDLAQAEALSSQQVPQWIKDLGPLPTVKIFPKPAWFAKDSFLRRFDALVNGSRN